MVPHCCNGNGKNEKETETEKGKLEEMKLQEMKKTPEHSVTNQPCCKLGDHDGHMEAMAEAYCPCKRFEDYAQGIVSMLEVWGLCQNHGDQTKTLTLCRR